jgi:regulatory protein
MNSSASALSEPAEASEPMEVSKPENRELLSRALALLSRREMGRSEFVTKLAASGFEKPEIEEAAAWCQSQGFLNETRYVEGVARRLSVKYGASRVASTLRGKGVTEDAIAEAMPDLKVSELDQARLLWARKFGAPGENAADKAKQMRYLQSRGFSFDTIKKVVRGDIE